MVSLFILVLGGVNLANKEVYRLSIKIGVNGDKKAKEKISSLESATEKAEKKIKKLDKANISPTAKLNDKASSAIDKIESKAKKFTSTKMTATAKIKDNATSGLDKIQNKAEKLDKTESKVKIKVDDQATSVMNKAQAKLNGWIKSGAKKIISIGLAGSVALGGIGASTAIKTFSDFEYGMKTVQATSQASEADLQKLTSTAKQLGATTSFSAVESAEAMNYLAMAGYKTNDIIDSMPGLLNAAAASGEDLASVSDIISDGITAFGMNASDTSHFADVLAQASANANTNIGMLGESFKYVGSLAGTMGYNVEDTSIALGLMANAGVKAGQGGTTLKNAIANMAAPTDTMATVMEKYSLSLADSEGHMKSLKSVMDMLREKMGGLSETEQSAAASHLFGKEAMAGMLSIINASEADYNKLTSAIYSADGAAQKMADTKLDSLSGQWTILKSAVEGMNISLGEKLAPYAKQFITWLTDKIPVIENKIVSVVDYISKHTGQIKAMATSLVAVGTAFAGLSVVSKISGVINGVKSFAGLFKVGNLAASAAGIGKSATVAAGGLGKLAMGAKVAALGSKALTFMTGPAGLAIGALAVTAGVTAHELKKEVVPAVDLFADRFELSTKRVTDSLGNTVDTVESTTIKISDSTKKNVGYYMEMDNKISKTLNKMKYTHQVMSEGIAEYFISNINQMSSKVTSKLEETKSNSDKILQDMFANSNLSSEQQGTITIAVDTVYSNQQQINNNASKGIIEEINAAKTEGREVDYSKITELQNQMRNNAITTLSETEKESAIIQGRIKDNSTRMTAEAASEIVQELEKQRQSTVDSANAEYAERVNIAEQIKNSGVEGASEAATQIIAEAERQRDDTIQAAKDTKQQGIDMLKQSYADLESQVSTDTGNIIRFWDRLKQWWNGNNFEPKTASIAVESNASSYTKGESNTTNGVSYAARFQGNTNVGSNAIPYGAKLQKNYTGTNYATAGLSTVNERGWELSNRKLPIIGEYNNNPLVNLQRGTKIRNHMDSVNDMKNEVRREVSQQAPRQKVQVFQPQLQVAGSGGNQFSFNMGGINIQNSDDKEQIIQQSCQEFARQFRELLFNVK